VVGGPYSPSADHILAEFGPERVMGGSDWPVVRLACDYGDWVAAAQTLTAHLSAAAQARVRDGTAAEFYRLGPSGP